MSLRLTFQVKLMSDYHIAAGHGTGAGIDSALLRDADDVPVIRGTTLTGLLRDGLWQLLQLPLMQDKHGQRCGSGNTSEERSSSYCGQFSADEQPNLCPICRLFGTPRAPKRWYIGSARPEEIVLPLSKASPCGGHPVRRVRISPRTRRAEPRKLFSQEDGDSRMTFQFAVTWPTSDESALDEAALLVAAARYVRQLGRSRRRGQGECLFVLTSLEGSDAVKPVADKSGAQNWQEWLLTRFAEKWLKKIPAPPTALSGATLAVISLSDNSDPIRVRMIIRTEEPLLIARRAEAGNQFESVETVTGQTVRGALAWRAAERYDLKDQTGETYLAFARIFFRNQVLFSDLFPARFDSSTLFPTIPAPRDLLTCKSGGLKHGFWFATRETDCFTCPGCSSPLTGVGDFVTLMEYDWLPSALFDHSPRQSSEMHIRLDPKTGRVTPGDLFSYVALDAGQYFVGDLICANAGAWGRLQALADIGPERPIHLRLGKAHRRGHGGVTAWFEVVEDDCDTWRPLPLPKRVKEQSSSLWLTLLTDTIITDVWGRYASGFEAGWLSEILGQEVKVRQAATGVRPIDGFNAHLGLPRWRDMALVAGSTVRLEVKPPINMGHLQELELWGIGLRRNEGFGQIAFNHPVYNLCRGVISGVSLGEEMGLACNAANPEALFRRRWAERLDKQSWNKCSDARFATVVRWLHANRYTTPAELVERLTTLGEPDQILRKEMIKDYGDRSKENKLQEQKDGIQVIADCILSRLTSEPERFWPIGIEMLAERVAEAVDPQKREEA